LLSKIVLLSIQNRNRFLRIKLMNKLFVTAMVLGLLSAGAAYANPGAGPAGTGPAGPGAASSAPAGGASSASGAAASGAGYSTSAAAAAATAIDAASAPYPLAVDHGVDESETR